MQIHRQTVHEDHFTRSRADQSRSAIVEILVIRIPRFFAVEMALDTETRPHIEFALDQRPHRFRLQTQRMTAEIKDRLTIGPLGKVELLAEMSQRIDGV